MSSSSGAEEQQNRQDGQPADVLQPGTSAIEAAETTELEELLVTSALQDEQREAALTPEERAQRERKARKKGLQITAFVFAILALLPGVLIPPAAYVLGLVAFILAAIALAKRRKLKGLSISDVVISVLAGIAATVMVFVYLSFAAVTLSDRAQELQELLQQRVTQGVDGNEIPSTVEERIREKLTPEEIAQAKAALKKGDVGVMQKLASKVVGRKITQAEVFDFLLTGDIPADIRENLLGDAEPAQ